MNFYFDSFIYRFIFFICVFTFAFDAPVKAEESFAHTTCKAHLDEANSVAKTQFKIIRDDPAQVEIESSDPLIDASDAQQKLKLFLTVLRPDPSCSVLWMVKQHQSDHVFYSSKIQSGDVSLFLSKKISWPELVRRISFREEATLVQIQKQLSVAKEQGQYDLALQWIERWLAQEPKNVKALLNKGQMLIQQKRYVDSLQVYQEVLSIDPVNDVALYNQAHAYAESGQLDEAIIKWRELIEKIPTLSTKWLHVDSVRLRLVKNLLQNQKLEEAIQVLNTIKTASIDKDVFQVHVLRAQNHYAEALAKNETLLTTSLSDKSLFLYNMIVLALDLKNKDKAVLHYEELKKQNEALAKDFSFLDHWQDEPTEGVSP